MDKTIIRKPATVEVSFTVPRPTQCTSVEQLISLGREAREETQRQLGQALWPYVSKENTKDGFRIKVSIIQEGNP